MRIIPKKTKVSIEFFKGVDIIDLIIGMIGIFLVAMVVMSSLPFKLPLTMVLIIIFGVLLVPIDEDKNYEAVLYILRYFAHPKVVKRNGKRRAARRRQRPKERRRKNQERT